MSGPLEKNDPVGWWNGLGIEYWSPGWYIQDESLVPRDMLSKWFGGVNPIWGTLACGSSICGSRWDIWWEAGWACTGGKMGWRWWGGGGIWSGWRNSGIVLSILGMLGNEGIAGIGGTGKAVFDIAGRPGIWWDITLFGIMLLGMKLFDTDAMWGMGIWGGRTGFETGGIDGMPGIAFDGELMIGGDWTRGDWICGDWTWGDWTIGDWATSGLLWMGGDEGSILAFICIFILTAAWSEAICWPLPDMGPPRGSNSEAPIGVIVCWGRFGGKKGFSLRGSVAVAVVEAWSWYGSPALIVPDADGVRMLGDSDLAGLILSEAVDINPAARCGLCWGLA